MLALNLILTLVAVLLFGAGLALLVYGLAKRDIFFTLVEPGTAKIVLLNNAFRRIVFNFPGYGMNEKHDIRNREKTPQDEIGSYREQTPFFGGLHFVGVPPFWSLYSYRLRWSVIWRNVEGGLEKVMELEGIQGISAAGGRLLIRLDNVTQFYLKATPYGLLLSGAEDKDKIAIDAIFLVMASVRNPYKAAFRVNNWWTAVSDNLLSEIRPWIGELSWEVIKNIEGDLLDYAKAEKAVLEATDPEAKRKIHRNWKRLWFSLPPAARETFKRQRFFENVLKLVNIMEDEWGVEVISIRIDEIVLPKGIPEAATKKYVAEQEAQAILAVAGANAERINKIFAAARAHGDDGVAMKLVEDLSNGRAQPIISVGQAPIAMVMQGLVRQTTEKPKETKEGGE